MIEHLTYTINALSGWQKKVFKNGQLLLSVFTASAALYDWVHEKRYSLSTLKAGAPQIGKEDIFWLVHTVQLIFKHLVIFINNL